MRFQREHEQAPEQMTWEEFKVLLRQCVTDRQFPHPNELPRIIVLSDKVMQYLQQDLGATMDDTRERQAIFVFNIFEKTISLTPSGTGKTIRADNIFRLRPGDVAIGSYHTHPPVTGELHLSRGDFTALLSQPSSREFRVFTLLLTTSSGFLMAIRTSRTPLLNKENLVKRLKSIEHDMRLIEKNIARQVLLFTKAVCLELGLVLYFSPSDNPACFHLVDVTQIPSY
ncbi:MAG: hypothetical protein GXP43_02790 [bacterium]|nr:hypothetical protein [bacterium]